MPTIGAGVREIRIGDASGGDPRDHIATLPDAIHVLHAFHKKTQKTAQRDLDLAARRLKDLRGKSMMKAKTFANVWDALEDSPKDAATMTMRSDVLAIIATTVRGWNITVAEAASRLGLTQPRLDDLLRERSASSRLIRF